jgi:hypothetical protein
MAFRSPVSPARGAGPPSPTAFGATFLTAMHHPGTLKIRWGTE